ncbi:MAG TPA: tetratricopeptide repeat protein [Terracidiphilus sp.]
MFAAFACAADAQTYQVAPGAPSASQPQSNQSQTPVQSSDQSLGWGSNIQNARLASAAQQAIARGDHALAFEYAQRAAKAAPNDPQLWFLLGYAARLDDRYQESVNAYNRGLHLSPSSLDGMSGLAQDYNLMGRAQDAERLLKQVTAADPRRANDLLLLGDISMRSKDYNGAVDWLNRAERIHPDARSELLLALSYQQLKQMDLASRYLNMAERRAPNNPDVQRSLAGYYREIGKYTEAIAALKSIRNPRPDVVAELAYTYQLDGKLDDSAKLYAKAADAVPKDMALQLSAAQAQVAVGALEDAQPFIERAQGLNPNDYRLHAIRGQIAQLQDRDQDAVTEYRSALANLPATPVEGPLYGIQLHMDLVGLYHSVGDEGAAHDQLQMAHNEISSVDGTGPGREQFLRLRALIKMNEGNLDGALSDAKEALAITPQDRNDLQLSGDILMKMGRVEDAITAYKQILSKTPNDRFALTSIGYASRAAGRDQDAEKYFQRLAQADPSLYVPYLALGDLYAARREFTKAQASYSKGYAIAPKNALLVAGGMNAAIEAHNLKLAGDWLGRVTAGMEDQPQILREKERYLSFEGQYSESAEIGRQAIKALPHDRDVVVYLGYDLLHLGQYDALLALMTSYLNVLPKEADIPLLAGYVHKHEGLAEQARRDFTEALERDPEVVTAYVNRGYMLNDLHQPAAAAADFEAALKREPHNGEAHLGLAYASLDLNRPQVAVREADLAERASGDSRDVHVIRATAFAREEMLTRAATEYRAALKFTPDDGALHLGLANVIFSERRYRDAIGELLIAEKFSPNDPDIDALLARSYANLDERGPTLQYVNLAEQHAERSAPAERSGIFISTGEALDTLGDENAAMDRFRRALEIPGSDRVGVRVAIAQVMAQQDHPDDAERQIALGWMEAAAGDAPRPKWSQFIAAADVFRSTHDYELSQTYLQRAKLAGAPDAQVRVGLADNYLAQGDTVRAQAELNAVNTTADDPPSYQYLLAEANVFRQEHLGAQALTSFAQASNAEGDDETAEESMLAAGADEGLRVTPNLSLLSDVAIGPIFEDTTVYVLDSKLDAAFPVPSTDTALLPPPRSSLQTEWTDAFHLHLPHMVTSSGFFQLRNARGPISVPATNSIVNRDTTDYTLNYGLNPTIHIGDNSLTFDAGVQETFRRDSQTPVQLNQNLFRAFAYVASSSFFDAISFSGYVIHESGPFTESNLHSSALTGALDFRVGSPWGKTALVTGWGMNDQTFSPVSYEDYYTSTYIGIDRRFSPRLDVKAILEDLRAWRVVGPSSGIAQDLRPSGTVDFMPKRNWDLQVSSAYSSTRGFHVYDAIQNGFSISYAKPLHRTFNDASGPVDLAYPIRFSAGMQEETFFNFTGAQNQQFRPYIEISIF